MRARGVAGAAALAALAFAGACGDEFATGAGDGGTGGASSTTSTGAGGAVTTPTGAGGDASTGVGGSTATGGLDAGGACVDQVDCVGLPCGGVASIRDCWVSAHHGPESACFQPGTQTCAGAAWGPCEGAGTARPTDACFDGVDDDCNGVVDDHCEDGSGLADLCAGLDGSHPRAFLLPREQALSAPSLRLYVLAREPIAPAGTNIVGGSTPGGYCAGSAGMEDLLPGPACGGWFAVRQTLSTADAPFAGKVAGAYVFEVFIGELDPAEQACVEAQAKEKVAFTFTLAP